MMNGVQGRLDFGPEEPGATVAAASADAVIEAPAERAGASGHAGSVAEAPHPERLAAVERPPEAPGIGVCPSCRTKLHCERRGEAAWFAYCRGDGKTLESSYGMGCPGAAGFGVTEAAAWEAAAHGAVAGARRARDNFGQADESGAREGRDAGG